MASDRKRRVCKRAFDDASAAGEQCCRSQRLKPLAGHQIVIRRIALPSALSGKMASRLASHRPRRQMAVPCDDAGARPRGGAAKAQIALAYDSPGSKNAARRHGGDRNDTIRDIFRSRYNILARLVSIAFCSSAFLSCGSLRLVTRLFDLSQRAFVSRTCTRLRYRLHREGRK